MFPFASSLLLSFDRPPLARPFDVLGLFFARLLEDAVAAAAAAGGGPGDSVAAVVDVVGVVAEETGCVGAETTRVGFGSERGMGRALSAGSSSMRSFSFRARFSRATESDIGRGTTSVSLSKRNWDEFG